MRGLLRLAVLSAAFTAAFAMAGNARAWNEIQAAVAREAGECVSWGRARVDCLARTANGSLSWTYLQNGKWSAPRDLGGKLTAAPSCVVRGPGGINCYAVSVKGVLATIYLNGKNWGKWSSLGGDLKPSRASCVGLGRDRIVCFARGRDGQLMARKWSGGKKWEPWRDLGGALSADPECILVGGASAACFGRGANGELVAFLPDAAGKSGGWTTLGGRIEGKPSCVRLKSGEAACVAQSRSGRLHMWRGMPLFAESAGLTSSIDDTVTAEPACALQGGTLVCFVRNSRRQLVRRSLGTGVDASRDGVILEAPRVAALACLSLGADGLGCTLTDPERRLHYATGQDLEAAHVETAETPTGAAAAGTWYLSNLGNGGICRIRLGRELAFGAKRLRIGLRCRALDLPSRPAQWEQDGNELMFLAVDGTVLLRFRSAQAGRWISPHRETTFLLTRQPPDDADAVLALAQDVEGAGPIASVFGPWRVVADGEGVLCEVSLANAHAGRGYAVHWDDIECDALFADVRYWTESGGALVFVGASNVVVARFDSAGPGAWRTQALGGLTLKR